MKEILRKYLKNITETIKRGDAREETFYIHLEKLIKQFAEAKKIKNVDVTILPKKTEAGNPDFRIWDGKNHITGYIEAKVPTANLDYIESTEQLKRYLSTFPNVILTNFFEFRLYRDGERIAQVMIGRPAIAHTVQTTPPLENEEEFEKLFNLFFSFSLPKLQTAKSLAVDLAKRTRFLRDEVISVEMAEPGAQGHKMMIGFYEAFKKYLISTLTQKQFADIYAQTITYGLFAARTRSNGEFNRKMAFEYIPKTIGILRDVFHFISLGDPPKSLQVIVDDIAEILNVADVNKILHEYRSSGKGEDPIVHFYETFLATYDPDIRERRGVYYTPQPVVGYIVRSIHGILKSHFGLPDGIAHNEVKLLDPAGGTLTFPAEAIRLAADEFKEKYGEGGLHNLIKNHILEDFYAFELMMAPYAIGHLKIGFIFEELGYRMSEEERFKLYLTNTLEMEEIDQIAIPGLSSLSEESHMAGEVKKNQPVLVILGNPPYSGISANINKWTEQLLKEDIDGVQSYYKVDGKPLGEKNPKWLQDDYVKFLRFAQWKIHKSGHGIVGMITNHSYLDNPTFRGMRQSLMKTFDEIYILNLHGNSLKKETAPGGGKDENVFDIRQGVAIALFIRNKKPAKEPKVYYADLYGLREEKYKWLEDNSFDKNNYEEIKPQSPYYFFVKRNTTDIQHYLKWKKINEIFLENSVGIVTARDSIATDFDKDKLLQKIKLFANQNIPDEIIEQTFKLKDTKSWKMKEARNKIRKIKDLQKAIRPILYRPFDIRYVWYYNSKILIERLRWKVMQHMFENNIGLTVGRAGHVVGTTFLWNLIFVSKNIIDLNLFYRGGEYLFPLYLYPDKNSGDLFEENRTEKKPNISEEVFTMLESAYGTRPAPEDILYYIYAVFYSNTYREKYAEFLKVDFPRVPFTANYGVFGKMRDLGKLLVELHLIKSSLLDNPVAKYRGSGTNDRIEKVVYKPEEGRIYINKDKYFEGVAPEVWNYHIGGYQVLQKYLKDRKGRDMDDAPHYTRIVTSLSKTIEIQKQIDEIYPEVEKSVIDGTIKK